MWIESPFFNSVKSNTRLTTKYNYFRYNHNNRKPMFVYTCIIKIEYIFKIDDFFWDSKRISLLPHKKLWGSKDTLRYLLVTPMAVSIVWCYWFPIRMWVLNVSKGFCGPLGKVTGSKTDTARVAARVLFVGSQQWPLRNLTLSSRWRVVAAFVRSNRCAFQSRGSPVRTGAMHHETITWRTGHHCALNRGGTKNFHTRGKC
jgi:hypothetical protein